MKMDYLHVNLLKGYNMLLYFSGGMILNEPTEECVIDFWTTGRLGQLPVTSFNPRFIRAAELLKNSCSDKTQCKNKLSEDYYRLFEVNAIPLAPAFESVYLRAEGLPERDETNESEFYNTYEWESEVRGKVSDDNLGIELLFLTHLIDRYLNLDDDPCRREMRKEIRRFIKDHLLSWIPKWNEDVQEHSRTLCYKGIGNLIYACVEDLNGLLAPE